MNLITTTGHYGLILDMERNHKDGMGVAGSLERRPEYAGHFVLLNRYKVDEDGYISLTPSLRLRDLYGSVDVFAAELLSLLDQAKQRFPVAPTK